ncbi:MAG: sialidase family protein [Limisphaerales bacterium]
MHLRFFGPLALLSVWLLSHPLAAADAPPAPSIISRGEAAGTYQAFTDVARLRNGDLFCVFYAGYGHVSLPKEGWPRGGRICWVRSRDEGRTWSAPRVLFDGPLDDRDPHVAAMSDGTVVCSFFTYQREGDQTLCDTGLVVSHDQGETWEAGARVVAAGWPSSAPVRELPDGTRLLGVYREDGNTAYGGVIRSTDGGRTWSAPIPIGKDSGVRLDAETDVFRRSDGTLYAALRGDRVNMHYATSADAGLTWSAVRDIGFVGHCPHFTRLSTGEILLTHRLPATALHVSRDEGQTWQGPYAIDTTGGAYASTVELRDGTVLVTYYEEGEGSAVRARRFRLHRDGPEFLPPGMAPIELGGRRELFVDDHLLERHQGTALKLHEPVLAGVALRFDRPWEGAFSGYVTVLQDGDRYRMYYRGNPQAGRDGSADEVTCYAESRDGVSWEKPDLDLFEVRGTRRNNVVLAGAAPFSHNFAPFVDARPGVPADERYKATAGTSELGLYGFVSADGLRWRKWRETPLVTKGAFDSQNVAFWSEAEQCYALYLRSWTGGGFAGFRTISRATSVDFLEWSEPREMSFGDTPLEHLYTSQTHPYFRAPHIYVALPMRFLPGRQVLTSEEARALGVDPGYGSDCAEAVLMTSRGGHRYTRTFMEGFIRPGLDPGNWASRAGLTALGVVPTGPTEMSLYKQAHYAQPSCHLLRYTLRQDGFISVNAPYAGGECVTRPFTFDGRRLLLNLATGAAGSVRVEMQDAAGQPLAGHALADCREMVGDGLEREVTWRNARDLGSLIGRPVRLRFSMKDADLYSLRFVR